MSMSWLRRGFLLSLLALASVALIACSSDDEDNTSASATDSAASGESTLEKVKDRGTLKCGISGSLPGFSQLEADGSYTGFDADYCRAIAAAVFGDSSKVEFVETTGANRFETLASGEVDVLIRNTTWTLSRDSDLKQSFAAPTFYDGQGMMVKADSPFQTLEDMDGATVCVNQGTTTELNLASQFLERGLTYTALTFETTDLLQEAFLAGRCDGWTTDKSGLASRRGVYPDGADALRILAVTMSKEPLGPLTRHGDDEWFDIVAWVTFGTFQAEELGVSSANVDAQIASPDSVATALLLGVGYEGGDVTDMGLAVGPQFMQAVLKQVGNYGEIYEKNITPLGLKREGSLNALWINGGLIYSPPIR
jgi:general L-amino acid transport system substrate-binding protein